MDYKELVQKAKQELNEKLKKLETYQDLKDFQKEMDSYGFGFVLVGKRRNYYAYSFTHLYEYKQLNGEPTFYTNNEDYLNRVHYLYSDGASTGESYVKNLHRVLKVED